ncbi:carboxypeptidase M32 [Candidatus Uabimicrobium amorphum]|uniref:Metal-dependent carboxypeptidase n=1 Tax=Uabimicrobium amorphum TaxID=2596890 RepID=A0A5S9F2B9_UABAM|nr:carboxypeptidase M32 [Candidatus Uabimicrobium amorphum]BBM82299.1 carboxypeptidase M32 [Candidatus Uabimicrobium amorphum]
MSKFTELLNVLTEKHLLGSSVEVLWWDQETYLPENAFAFRGEQVSLLSKLKHERFTSKATGDIINRLYEELQSKPENFDHEQSVIIRCAHRDYTKLTKLPASFIAEQSQAISKSMSAWLKAREQKDFAIFAPHLEKVIELAIQKSRYIDSSQHPYDVALDEYEPGFTVNKLDVLFAGIKKALIPTLPKVLAHQNEQKSVTLTGCFDVEKQKQFVNEVLKDLGFDFSSGRMDLSVHPFAITLGPEDVRVTSRFNNTGIEGIYSSIHECGHGLYEQGLNKKYPGTGLAEATSIGVHESQSRFWEVFVGREKPFITRYLPRLQELFPHLKHLSEQDFYRAINHVNASPTRIGADEISYHLHITLRYEMERDLFNGDIKVKDVPEVWSGKIRDYLGVEVKDDLQGALQDIHWAQSLLGYFPTYTIGSMYAAQFLTTMYKEISDFDQNITSGNFHPLYNWLAKNIFSAGRSVNGPELIENVTGEEVSEKYLLGHLQRKWSDDMEVSCAG